MFSNTAFVSNHLLSLKVDFTTFYPRDKSLITIYSWSYRSGSRRSRSPLDSSNRSLPRPSQVKKNSHENMFLTIYPRRRETGRTQSQPTVSGSSASTTRPLMQTFTEPSASSARLRRCLLHCKTIYHNRNPKCKGYIILVSWSKIFFLKIVNLKVNVVLDGPSRRSRGFAFLYFETVATAKEAKEVLPNKSLNLLSCQEHTQELHYHKMCQDH